MCTIRRISHMKAKKVESTNTFNAKTQLEATSLSFQNIRQILFVFCFINFGNEQSTFIMTGKVVYDEDILSQGLE